MAEPGLRHARFLPGSAGQQLMSGPAPETRAFKAVECARVSRRTHEHQVRARRFRASRRARRARRRSRSRSGAADRRSSRRARTSRDERGAGRAGPRHAAASPELAPRERDARRAAVGLPRLRGLACRAGARGKGRRVGLRARGLGRSLLRLRRTRAAAAHALPLDGARHDERGRVRLSRRLVRDGLLRSGRVEGRVDRRSRPRAEPHARRGSRGRRADPRGRGAVPAGRVAHTRLRLARPEQPGRVPRAAARAALATRVRGRQARRARARLLGRPRLQPAHAQRRRHLRGRARPRLHELREDGALRDARRHGTRAPGQERDRDRARLGTLRRRDAYLGLGLDRRGVARDAAPAPRAAPRVRGRHVRSSGLGRHVESERRRAAPLRQPVPRRDVRRAARDRGLARARLRRLALGRGPRRERTGGRAARAGARADPRRRHAGGGDARRALARHRRLRRRPEPHRLGRARAARPGRRGRRGLLLGEARRERPREHEGERPRPRPAADGLLRGRGHGRREVDAGLLVQRVPVRPAQRTGRRAAARGRLGRAHARAAGPLGPFEQRRDSSRARRP